MTKIIVYSHKNDLGEKSLKLKNGDIYDSKLEVYKDDKLVHTNNYLNVDSSHRYNYKVEIENGIYGWIAGFHGIKFNEKWEIIDKGYPALYLFKKELLDTKEKLSWRGFIDGKWLDYRVLPSLYPNPNWNNAKICKQINVHAGSSDVNSWDYSAGCLTIVNSYYDSFINSFWKENEVGILEKR